MSVTIVVVIIIVFLCFVPTGFSIVNSTDFLNFVLAHKSPRAVPPSCSLYCLQEPQRVPSMQGIPRVCELSWDGKARLHTLASKYTAHHFWSLHHDPLLITQELKWPQNTKEEPSHLNTSRHSPYYAKCYSGFFPENTGSSQVPRDSLHPADKVKPRKLYWMNRMILWLAFS